MLSRRGPFLTEDTNFSFKCYGEYFLCWLYSTMCWTSFRYNCIACCCFKFIEINQCGIKVIKARPASGYNPIIKNLNFNQIKIQINTPPMWHCAEMCNWCKSMQMITQTNNFYTKHVHVLPDLTQFREGGVMTCQSPTDTLTGMWGNLVYHIWEPQWSAHKWNILYPAPILLLHSFQPFNILIQEKGLLITATDSSVLVHIF